ncbi:LysR family transcriptional regulator [Rhodovibrionaceae bacterium A322]
MDNISEMEVFVRVVQAKSFSGAARNLGLSPSAVSKQIGRLEDRLGARLLNRTTRQLSLTEVGSAFFQRSERIITDVSEAELAVSHLHGAPRGTLRVNAPVSYGRRHIAPLIPEFLDGHDEVQLDLTVNDRFVDLVEEGVDVAIRIGELADSSLIARKLAPNRRLVCASPDYLAKHGTPKQPTDLADHNCMTYTYRAQRHEWHFDGPSGHEVVTVNGDMETNNAEVLHAAVLGHHGICLLPLWLAGEDLCAGRLVELMPDYKVPDSAIYAVYPHNRHLSPKVRSFVDFLAEHLDRRTQDWETKGC